MKLLRGTCFPIFEGLYVSCSYSFKYPHAGIKKYIWFLEVAKSYLDTNFIDEMGDQDG